MRNDPINAYFHLASHGEKEAYNSLYKEFVNRANKKIKNTTRANSNFLGFSGDFCDLIDELFFKAINEYGPEKGTFHSFVDFLLSRRLVPEVKKKIYLIQSYTMDIDFDDEDVNSIEYIQDPNHTSLTDDIAVLDFKQMIASPNAHKTREKRLRDKVLLLQYGGYKNKEICEILKITYAQLRRVLEKARGDDDLNNIKLDLK